MFSVPGCVQSPNCLPKTGQNHRLNHHKSEKRLPDLDGEMIIHADFFANNGGDPRRLANIPIMVAPMSVRGQGQTLASLRLPVWEVAAR